MAAKEKTQYICTNCGAVSSAWSGRCYNCGEWNTLEAQATLDTAAGVKAGKSLQFSSVATASSKDHKRIDSGIEEVDTVLGGGFVAGSVNLIAGQPGIGKSTLLMQVAGEISKRVSVLYVSGEESAHQVGTRAERLGVAQKQLQIATANSANDIAATIARGEFKLVVVDSVQMIGVDELSSAAGTVSQITASTQLITAAAKSSDTAVILVGHVTKEGSIAGPKVLEHVVDVVLQLEGDRYGGFKVLRAIKNRYGSTNEAGIFEMQQNGLQPVTNPSQALLEERQVSDGSIVLATMEGSRPLLVEVQALVNTTSYGYPKRAASGLDLNRLNLLVAMLEKRTKLTLADKDIYVNIVGGIKITEPAADLAVCMAIGTAAKGLQLSQNFVVFGEVGLLGEVRHVPYVEKRLSEAKKLGFDGAIGPKTSGLSASQSKLLHVATDVRSALNQFLESDRT
jgi:DNA repair protein RadA/Sms